MHAASQMLKNLTRAAFLVATFLTAGSALAVGQPPQEPAQQRAWLVGHLVIDMEALGTFDGNALAKVPAIVNRLTDDQVALLAQYYFLTRSKTLQDAYLYSLQQQGNTDEQVNAAKAEIADLLTVMHDQAVACYDQFAPMPEPVQYLAQICYASVPGWCCHARCYVPEWYYDNGSYVGPCFDAAYAGDWAGPVCNAYYDHGSGFYGRYHGVADTVHARRSIRMAHRHADRLRNHGDWKSVMAHDRFLHRSPAAYRSAAPRQHVGNRQAKGRSLQAHRAEAGRSRVGGNKPLVARQKLKFRATTVRPSGVRRQAAKPRAAAARSAKPHQQAAKPRVGHASARHSHAPRLAAHATHPRPAAHLPKARPAPHAPAHAASGGYSRHR